MVGGSEEKRLDNLRSKALDFINDLPTFVCSEISKGKPNTMLVRFGTISDTMANDKEVATVFHPIVEFGAVSFESIDDAKELVGADGFQLYRTHWAVRPGDYQAILGRLAELAPRGQEDVQRILHGPPGAAAEPPARRKNEIGQASSVEDFLKIIEDARVR